MTETSTLPAHCRDLLASVPTGLYIGGAFRSSSSGATFGVEDPASGEMVAEVADTTTDDARLALDAAVRAGADWAATPPRERSELLRAAFERVIAQTDTLALLMSVELGRALPDSRSEVIYGAEFLRWFAEEAVRIDGRYTTSPSGNGRILVTHQPVGPVYAITPWNFPLAMGTRKIGPALAAGCPIIVKPAEDTPLTMLALAQIFDAVGLPAGVLSVLPTSEAAEVSTTIISDDRVRKISFTGSTQVGRILLGQAADNVQRTSMELGGNAPFVVFEDADIDLAIEGAHLAKMRNGGEACTAANRFLVHESIAEKFTAALVERMSKVTVGPGYLEGTVLGPLVNRQQYDSVSASVIGAIGDGGRIRLGGKAIDRSGYFYPPTVIDNVPIGAPVTRAEIFGPVAVISTFTTEDQAVDAANSTEYGLSAYIFTRDIDRALRVADRLESGMVGINRGVISDVAAPFGGVKQSGLGREGGSEGIHEYLTTKYVAFP